MGEKMNINVVCKSCGKVNRLPKRELKKANCGQCKNSLLDPTPVELTDSSFDNHIVNSSIPVVVDFWAGWCGPCKMMAPAFKEAAGKFVLRADFAKVNTEEWQMTAGRFGIRSIPTMIVFKEGKEVGRQSGALSAEQIVSWVGQFTD